MVEFLMDLLRSNQKCKILATFLDQLLEISGIWSSFNLTFPFVSPPPSHSFSIETSLPLFLLDDFILNRQQVLQEWRFQTRALTLSSPVLGKSYLWDSIENLKRNPNFSVKCVWIMVERVETRFKIISLYQLHQNITSLFFEFFHFSNFFNQ